MPDLPQIIIQAATKFGSISFLDAHYFTKLTHKTVISLLEFLSNNSMDRDMGITLHDIEKWPKDHMQCAKEYLMGISRLSLSLQNILFDYR